MEKQKGRGSIPKVLLGASVWILMFSLSGGEQKSLIVFRNITILPMNEEVLLEEKDLFVAGGRVLEITATGQKEIPRDAKIIDGNGRYVLPGLIDAHVHLTDEKGLKLFLMNGVTTVRVMEGKSEHLEWRRRIENGEILGPHLVVSTPILFRAESKRFYQVSTPEQARSDIRMFHDAGYDWIKTLRLDKSVFKVVMEEAKKWNMPVGGHNPNLELDRFYGDEIHGAPEERISFHEVLTSGMASLEHIGEVAKAGLNGELEPDRIPALVTQIKDSGIVITPTIHAGIQWNEMLLKGEEFLDSEKKEKIRKYLGMEKLSKCEEYLKQIKTYDAETRRLRTNNIAFDLELLKALGNARVRLVTGSDTGGSCSIPGMSLKFEVGEFVHAGLTSYQALRSATYEGARLLNRQSTLGTIEVGKKADLIVLQKNPLQDIRAIHDINGVLFEGRWMSSEDLKQNDDSFSN